MPLFEPDLVAFGDSPGFGRWRTGHYLEHKQFVQIGFKSSPVFIIPDYDFWQWSANEDADAVWAAAHATVHQIIDNQLGISGFDFSDLNLTDQASFDLWMQAHRTEHINIRTALGITT